MNRENSSNIEIKDEKIRRHYDEKSHEWYFSIVDIIGVLGETSDPRNYWKTLKNRLKKAQNKLVTECNQVKMKASDGKSYLTDVASSETMLEIIKLTSPDSLSMLEEWFNKIKHQSHTKINSSGGLSTSLEENSEAELMVDIIETNTNIIIKAFIAGVNHENMLISVTCDNLIISGERENKKNIIDLPALHDSREQAGRNYFIQELFWGKFYRTIKLPSLIEIDKSEATVVHGLLIINLTKINRERERRLKPSFP